MRSAINGSTREACRAGTYAARIPITDITLAAPDKDADVRRAQPEEQTLRYAGGDERQRDPEHDSGRRPHELLADRHPQHLVARRAKRHPEPQLARALNDVIGDEAVQTQAGQADRQHPEGRPEASPPFVPGRACG